VIISETKAFVFIHVPKCAGTSIRNSLSPHDTRNNYFWMHHYLHGASESSPSLPIDKAHMPLAILKNLYPSDFVLLSEYTTFAASRHPLERLISAFFEPRKELLELAASKNCDTIAQIQDFFKHYVTRLTTDANFLDPTFVHATPQSYYHVYKGKIMTDAIIRLEDPQRGIAKLKYLNPTAGFAAERALETSANASKTITKELNLWKSLPLELREKCASLYQDDCDLLGYKFNEIG
jgi:hypothetical protein